MEITVDKIREMFYYNRSNGMILARFSAPGKLPWRDAGTKSKNRYKIVSIGGIYISAHRLAWAYVYGEFPSGIIDHIDGDVSNNSISNLRIADKTKNAENQRRPHINNKLGVLGVYLRKNGRYNAQIKVNGKKIHLGYYGTIEEAKNAYLDAKRMMHDGCTI